MTMTGKPLGLVLSFVASVFFCGAVVAGGKPDHVTVGYIDLVNPLLIAKHLKMVEKELGVPVKWVKFDSGVGINSAIASGSINFGSVGNPPAAVGVAAGLPYKGIFILDVLGAVESLAVRGDIASSGVKGLVGKRIAVPFGTTSHYELINALKRAGISQGSVKIIDMNPPDILAAWKRGAIDGAYVWQPVLGKIVGSGGKIIVTSDEMAKAGFPTWDIAVVRNDFAKKYPGVVTRYVKALSMATDYWQAHYQKANALIADELSVKRNEVTQMMDGTGVVSGKDQLTAQYLGTPKSKGRFVDSLYSTARFLYTQKRLSSIPGKTVFSNFIDPSYLETAVTSAK
ncbi:MAG: ABC transporter substrate-binding protein [Gammaproteobacteria bacterium]|nr:ABC transporter substrate-binding protein [Gammaproteobacteria bacterium]